METYTIQKINQWKNGKGAFVLFEERPETYYINGNPNIAVGQVVDIVTRNIPLGEVKDSVRIESLVPHGSLPSSSAIVQAQKSTGAKLNTPVVDVEKNSDFFLHEVIAKQAEKIIEQGAVINKLITRLDDMDRKILILQKKVGVSFI